MTPAESSKKMKEVTAELERLTAHAEALARKRSEYLLRDDSNSKANLRAIDHGNPSFEIYDDKIARLLSEGPNLSTAQTRIAELEEIQHTLETKQPSVEEIHKAEAEATKLCKKTQDALQCELKADETILAALEQIEHVAREKIEAHHERLTTDAQIQKLRDDYDLNITTLGIQPTKSLNEKYLSCMSLLLRELAESVSSLSHSLLAELNAAKEAMKKK